VILQHLVHAGRPHGPEDACQDVHCASCGRDGPHRYAVVCGECFHGWRWRWMLTVHDAWLSWKLGRRSAWGPRAALLERIRIRRPRKIWVCPCCAHDL